MPKTPEEKKVIAGWLIVGGLSLFFAVMFLYFFAIYHMPGMPWSTWYGIPLFILYTFLGTGGVMASAACISTGTKLLGELPPTTTEKNGERI